MTKAELKNALPEMLMFAKSEEDRNHFKKLQALESSDELNEVVKQYAMENEVKNDYKASMRYRKTART